MKYPKTSRRPVKRTSDILCETAHTAGNGSISLGDFIALLEERSFALAILILSLPNSLPMPGIPGLSTLTGVPILFIALQIIGGRTAIWLPKRVAARRLKGEWLTKVIHKALPAVIWLEKYLHPRLSVICQSMGERLIGLLIAIMAFILALPIAGANFLPAVCISLLALALLEDDGVFAGAGIVLTLGSLYAMCEVMLLVAHGAMHWMPWQQGI